MNLSLSTLLDVLLSLTFVFFIVSMFVSGIWEFINTALLDKRATLLKSAFTRMVADPKFADLLYDYPLIRGQIVTRTPGWVEKQGKRAIGQPLPEGATVQSLPSYVSPNSFARFLVSLSTKYPPTANTTGSLSSPTATFQALQTWVNELLTNEKLPLETEAKDQLQQLLSALLQDADGLDKLMRNIENWYNDYMDRVSGYFKRYSQQGVRWVAIAVVVFFNLDAVHMTIRLFRDPALRALFVNEATELAQRSPGVSPQQAMLTLSIGGKFVRDSGAAVHKILASVPDSAKKGVVSPALSLSLQAAMRPLQTERDSLLRAIQKPPQTYADSVARQLVFLTDESTRLDKLPVGWNTFLDDFDRYWHQKDRLAQVSWFLLTTLIGWILTVGAVSFGAPFWFDLLLKVVNVRSVGKNPNEKT